MLVAVLVLAVTDAAALAAVAVLLWQRHRPAAHPRPSARVQTALDSAPAPEPSSSATRQIISIEILNPVELARTRGRLAGLAGQLAPGLARRMVVDQAVTLIREAMLAERAEADVRVHTIGPRTGPPSRDQPNPGASRGQGRSSSS